MTYFLIKYFILFQIGLLFIFAAMAGGLVWLVCWSFNVKIERW